MRPASHIVLLECMHWFIESYDAEQADPAASAERVCTAELYPHAESVMAGVSPQGLGVYRAVYLADPGVQIRPRLAIATP